MARPNPWFSPPALQYVARFSPAFLNPPQGDQACVICGNRVWNFCGLCGAGTCAEHSIEDDRTEEGYVCLECAEGGTGARPNPPYFFNPPRRKLWVKGVEPRWHSPYGLFSEGSAEEIADEILEAHGYDLASSMQSLQFYINRAGKNLSRLRVLNRAKQIIRQEGVSRAEQRERRPMRAAANPAFFPYYPNPSESHCPECGSAYVQGYCPDCDWGEEEEESPECPQCGGPAGLLGRLGSREHLSCRNCGWEFSRVVGGNPFHCSGYEFSCDEEDEPRGLLSYHPEEIEHHARDPHYLPRPVHEYMDNPWRGGARRNATCFTCMNETCPCGCQGDESLCVCPNPLSWDEAQSTLEHVDKYRTRAREEDPDWRLYYAGAARGALRPLKYGHPALYEMEKQAQRKFERGIFRGSEIGSAANPLEAREVNEIMSGVRSHHARARGEEDPVQSAYYGGRAYEGRRIADRYGSVPWSASRAAANPRTCDACTRGDHDRCSGCLCWCSATGFYPALTTRSNGKYFSLRPQVEEGEAFPSRPFSHGQLRRTMETDRMHRSRMKGIIRHVAKKEFGVKLSDASIDAMLGRSRAQLAEEGRHRLSKIKARADQIFYAQSRKFHTMPGTEISEETVPEPARGRRVRIVKIKRKKKAGAKKKRKVG